MIKIQQKTAADHATRTGNFLAFWRKFIYSLNKIVSACFKLYSQTHKKLSNSYSQLVSLTKRRS